MSNYFNAGEKVFDLSILTNAYLENGNRCYTARCKCGQITTPRHKDLILGRSKSCRSCGAKGRVKTRRDPANRGKSRTPVYKAWNNMRRRVERLDYIRRGITICEEWSSFTNFEQWAKSGFEDGLTLDRIDNDRGYEPGNCRWATAAEQQRNKSNSITDDQRARVRDLYATTDMTQAQIAEATGVSTFSVSRILRDPIVAEKMEQLRRPRRGGVK